MEDTRVADRELQATIDGKKATRTTAMTIQVDPGSLRAINIRVERKTPSSLKLVKIAPRVGPPATSHQSSVLLEPIEPVLSQALGLGLALIIRRQSSWTRIGRLQPRGTAEPVVCVEISAPSTFRVCLELSQIFRTKNGELRLRRSSVRSPLTPPRTSTRIMSPRSASLSG